MRLLLHKIKALATNIGQKMLCGGEKMEQKLRRDRDLGDNLRRLRNASGLLQEKLCAEL